MWSVPKLTQDFCQSVFGLPISTGAIQRIVDRASEAFLPICNAIGDHTRQQKVNCVDETSWFQSGKPQWLWTRVNHVVAFFMIHPIFIKTGQSDGDYHFPTIIRYPGINASSATTKV